MYTAVSIVCVDAVKRVNAAAVAFAVITTSVDMLMKLMTSSVCAASTARLSVPGTRAHHLWFSFRLLLFPQLFHDPV